MNNPPDIKTISILGCGWLGAPLARNLMSEEYILKGSTQHTEKKSVMKDVGIKPYLLTLSPHITQLNPDDFFITDLLIITIPTRVAGEAESFYTAQIKAVADEILKHSVKKCICIASAEVYPETEGVFREDYALDMTEPPRAALKEAESILQNIKGLDLTILRCGEIFGYNRTPQGDARFSGLKKTINTSVNFVHRDDVISVINKIIQQNYWNQILNVVAPAHPPIITLLQKNTQDVETLNFVAVDENLLQRKVSSTKLISDLKYRFLFPDPLNFRYS